MDEKIEVKCPSCQVKIRANVALLGKKVKCPKCKSAFDILTPNASSAPIELEQVNQEPLPQGHRLPKRPFMKKATFVPNPSKSKNTKLAIIIVVVLIVIISLFVYIGAGTKKEAEKYSEYGKGEYNLGDNKSELNGQHDKSTSIDPNFPYINRGVAKDDRGDYKGAIEDYDKAISINPGFLQAYINRGGAKAKLADYKGAVKDYDKAISIDPNWGGGFIV